jgi:hypothetical protein
MGNLSDTGSSNPLFLRSILLPITAPGMRINTTLFSSTFEFSELP